MGKQQTYEYRGFTINIDSNNEKGEHSFEAQGFVGGKQVLIEPFIFKPFMIDGCKSMEFKIDQKLKELGIGKTLASPKLGAKSAVKSGTTTSDRQQ